MAQWWESLTLINFAELAFALLSVLGQHFNSNRDKRGFVFWVVGNLLACAMFGYQGRWVMAALYAYFLLQSVRGFALWARHERVERSRAPLGAGGSVAL